MLADTDADVRSIFQSKDEHEIQNRFQCEMSMKAEASGGPSVRSFLGCLTDPYAPGNRANHDGNWRRRTSQVASGRWESGNPAVWDFHFSTALWFLLVWEKRGSS
jgi:hypothetical protein